MRTSQWKLITASACCAIAGALSVAAGVAGPPTTMVIAMHELNGSGQNGTATLTAEGDKVLVTVHISGEPAGASEPSHVHFGRCPLIRAVPAYNVGPIVNGTATSTVDLSWKDITSGRYVLNVHESAAMLGKYMSCGNIGAAAPMPIPTEDSGY
jgi:hypothetical protein